MKVTDAELLLQIMKTDSESAFRALFDRHYDRMFRIAVYFLQNDDWAKEVTLDVLAHLWENRRTAIIPDNFRHYTFVLVKNAALNVLKKEAKVVGSEEFKGFERFESKDGDATPMTADPHSLLEESELFELYEQLLSELPDRCRAVFCLVKEDGLSYAEAADALQISVKTVDAQLQKALQYLRSNLSKYLGRDHGKRFFAIFL